MEPTQRPSRSLEFVAAIYGAFIAGALLFFALIFSSKIRDWIYSSLSHTDFTVSSFFVIILFILVLSVTFLFCYRKRLKAGFYIGILFFSVLAVRSIIAVFQEATLRGRIVTLLSAIVASWVIYTLHKNRGYFSKKGVQ